MTKIEAVIIKPQYTNELMVGGDLMTKETYQVYLKQWEKRNNINTLEDELKLRDALQCLYLELNYLEKYRLTDPIITSSNKKIGLIETANFSVYSLYNQSLS